jgi:Na+-translocating ferredoxin:NAD+ oxidoreductase RnfC subunit
VHQSRSQVVGEVSACIRCNECLAACPALPMRMQIETLNRETLGEHISPDVARFAHACYQCGACVPVCPVGLHRDAMMLWLKMRLLQVSVDSAEGWQSARRDRMTVRWR